jgi:hypothetical protein
MYLSAEKMQTMDMGLPSYGDIADPNANSSKLVEDYDELPAPKKEKKARPKKEESEGDNLFSGLLPSTKKSGPKTAKPKPVKPAAPAAKPKAEKEESGPKYEIMDMALPTYSDSTSGKGKSMFSL